MSRASYQCVRPCFFQGRLWEIGTVAAFADGEWPKGKDGKMRHFVLIDQPSPPAPIEESGKTGESPPEPTKNKGIDLEDEDRVFPQKRSPKPKKAK
jgi:hypothetical protein